MSPAVVKDGVSRARRAGVSDGRAGPGDPSISGRKSLVSWRLWIVTVVGILVAVAMVWDDPFWLYNLSAIALDYHPKACEEDDCLRPVPDVDAWPADPSNKLLNATVFAHTGVPGPESLAWDQQGRGPYTGVADGRVIRWNDLDRSWETFAVVSPYWTKESCDFKNRGSEYPKLESLCGRPLGLKFDNAGSLYIADAYFGLAVVGPEGGLAKILCNESDSIAHKFTNDLDIHEDGTVYFTVSSTRRQRKDCNLVVMEGDTTGRVLKFEPRTGETRVLLRNVKYPNGVAISKDSSFLVIASTTGNRLLKYWLKGTDAGRLEDFAHQAGYPDNVRLTDNGDFWVPIHGRRTNLHVLTSKHIWVAKILYVFQVSIKSVGRVVAGENNPMVIKYNADGEAVAVLEDRTGSVHAKYLSTAQERQGTLWMSSIYLPRILIYELNISKHKEAQITVEVMTPDRVKQDR